jgi:putative ABC transport system substrate-binding protein
MRIHKRWFKERSRIERTEKWVYGWREGVVADGLLSYSADLPASFRDAAKFVDTILTGTNPADLPVEPASKFKLFINLKPAKALGLTIPQLALQRSD